MKVAAAAVVVVAGLSIAAQAAEPQTLTLACTGTATETAWPDQKPVPISMGLIVNFTTRTVQGFADYPVKITGLDDVTVAFRGSQTRSSTSSVSGSIDRVTGDVEATSMLMNGTTILTLTSYALRCRPAQRIF
jgi:hypothetical protein